MTAASSANQQRKLVKAQTSVARNKAGAIDRGYKALADSKIAPEVDKAIALREAGFSEEAAAVVSGVTSTEKKVTAKSIKDDAKGTFEMGKRKVKQFVDWSSGNKKQSAKQKAAAWIDRLPEGQKKHDAKIRFYKTKW